MGLLNSPLAEMISLFIQRLYETVPVVNIQPKIKGMVEQNPAVLLNNDGLISEAQRSLQQEIENKTEKLLYKIQNADIDPYGFGLHSLAQYFGDETTWEHSKTFI
jgi:Spore germination B3/ GerAC like, C-terminal